MNKKKLLLVGWDGADWDVIYPLIEQGLMPNLERLVENGVSGNIATLEPAFSPMLWTSIATGKTADKHGVLGFSEPSPNNKSIRPISGLTRQVKAIWNILQQNGCKVHNIGWWPSHPAEPINGVSVSNLFQQSKTNFENWKHLDASVHPEKLMDLFHSICVHPDEITAEILGLFVPMLDKIDQKKDKTLNSIAKIVAENSNIHSCATWVLENLEWDFLSVYYDGIDHFSHSKMIYHPPKLPSIKEEDFQLYKDVVSSGYRYHDMMLGRLLELAGDDASVILLSDHGFESGHLRKITFPNEPAGPAEHHRNLGILCIKGEGIKKDELIFGNNLLNITPTILQMYNLPVGKDMDGAVIVDAFEEKPEIQTINSWEDIEGDCGSYPEELKNLIYDDKESIQQLVDLGYIEDPGENVLEAISTSKNELDYNLARVYAGSNRYKLALPIFEKLHNNDPTQGRYAFHLIRCCKSLNLLERCWEILDSYSKVNSEFLQNNKAEDIAKEMKELNEESDKNKEKQKKARLAALQKTQKRIRQSINDIVQISVNKADLYMLEGKYKKASELYLELENKAPNSIGFLLKLGEAFYSLNMLKKSVDYFNKVLSLSPESSSALSGLTKVYFKKSEYEKCIDFGLSSLGIDYHQPYTHYYIGISLKKLQKYNDAAAAFEVALHMFPGMGIARNELISLYEKELNNPQKAIKLKEFFHPNNETIKDDTQHALIENSKILNFNISNSIVVVSGLPRSGTSLIMQMLKEAEIDLYTDEKRQADSNNINGYFEHENVKRIARNKRWLPEVMGKGVKIISHLLRFLPQNKTYKIIYIERELTEILDSQQKMIKKNTGKNKNAYKLGLHLQYVEHFKKVDNWLMERNNVEFIKVSYKETIQNPLATAQKIVAFLNLKVAPKKLAAVVDKKLYRSKSSKT